MPELPDIPELPETWRPRGGTATLVHVAILLVVAALVIVAGFVIAGHGDANASDPAAARQTSAGPVPGYSITIPKLGVGSDLVGLGLNPDRTIQVPPLDNPLQAGVYTQGPLPGQNGPAVVLAHVNAHGQPGFGAGFHTLAGGDAIDVTTPGGPVHYRVTRTVTVPKSQFPTAAVYSDTPGPELRLITCGGALDQNAHNYVGQTIVWATALR